MKNFIANPPRKAIPAWVFVPQYGLVETEGLRNFDEVYEKVLAHIASVDLARRNGI